MRMLSKLFNLNHSGWGKKPDSSSDPRSSDANDPPKNDSDNPRPPEGQRPKPKSSSNDPLADVTQKLKKWFGPSEGGSSGGNGTSSGSSVPKKLPFIVLVVCAVYWLYTGVYTIAEGQLAVITQFGRYHSQIETAGIHWRLPSPFQEHTLVDAHKVRTIILGTPLNQANSSKENLVLTKGERVVNIHFVVNYRLKLSPVPEGEPTHVQNFLFENYNSEATVRDAAESAMQEVVGRHEMQSILSADRAGISDQVVQRIQSLMDQYRTGIEITTVSMEVQPPQKIFEAFNDTLIAEQDRVRLEDEGNEFKRNIIRRASSEARNIVTQAEAYRESIRQRAQGESARFLSLLPEYKKAPAVTRDRLYLETLESIYASTAKVYVDAKTTNPSFYLPLLKGMMQGDVPSSSSESPSTSSSPPKLSSAVKPIENTPPSPNASLNSNSNSAAPNAPATPSTAAPARTGGSFWSDTGNLWTR